MKCSFYRPVVCVFPFSANRVGVLYRKGKRKCGENLFQDRGFTSCGLTKQARCNAAQRILLRSQVIREDKDAGFEKVPCSSMASTTSAKGFPVKMPHLRTIRPAPLACSWHARFEGKPWLSRGTSSVEGDGAGWHVVSFGRGSKLTGLNLSNGGPYPSNETLPPRVKAAALVHRTMLVIVDDLL